MAWLGALAFESNGYHLKGVSCCHELRFQEVHKAFTMKAAERSKIIRLYNFSMLSCSSLSFPMTVSKSNLEGAAR
jgi:hypothetical protein